MTNFPIDKCQVVWEKDVTSEVERQEILKDLRNMSVELQEAIDFTIKSSNRKSNEIKYWLDTETGSAFTLSIYYETHSKAWVMLIEKTSIQDNSIQVVGELACLDPMTVKIIEDQNILKTEPITDM